MTRLSVLLLTSKKILKPNSGIIGEAPLSFYGDTEAEDYVELLSACNIPFDIKYVDELKFEDIVSGEGLNYASLILALPVKCLTREGIGIIKKASEEYGISLIASCDRIDTKIMHLFGICGIGRKRFKFPCSILVRKDKFADPNIKREIKFGCGFKLQLSRGGLRRQPLNYFKKHLKILVEQVWFYQDVQVLPETEILANIKGNTSPAILKYKCGAATNYYISLQSDTYLDGFNSMHRIVRELIKKNSGFGMVNIKLENTMVLRMDDPGSCERVYLKGYDSLLLDEEGWSCVRNRLKEHNARLSVMYVPLWADDGNRDNGRLFINKVEITERPKGKVYHSKDVVFEKANKDEEILRYDYAGEYPCLKEGARSGLIEIESHGLTHVNPDLGLWSKAGDRYENCDWYREFRHVPEKKDCTRQELERIAEESARAIEQLFGVSPCAISPSGHVQSRDAEMILGRAKYNVFSSDYNTMNISGKIVRNDMIQSVFLSEREPDASFTDSGYPVVGVFHDYDIVKKGDEWLSQTLKAWKEAGVSSFITLRTLAGYLCSSIRALSGNNKLEIEIRLPGQDYSLIEPALEIHLPSGKNVKTILIDNTSCKEQCFQVTGGMAQIQLPPFAMNASKKIEIVFE